MLGDDGVIRSRAVAATCRARPRRSRADCSTDCAAAITAGGEAGPVHSAGIRWSRTCPGPSPICASTGTTTRSANCAELWTVWEPQQRDYRVRGRSTRRPPRPTACRGTCERRRRGSSTEPGARKTGSWLCRTTFTPTRRSRGRRNARAPGWPGCCRTPVSAVEQQYVGLPTAFRAHVGSGPLHLAVCAEYDALPGLGHACGHNVISAIAVGAGAGSRPARRRPRHHPARSSAPPPRKAAAARSSMLERGAFDGLHAAVMAHPGPVDVAAGRAVRGVALRTSATTARRRTPAPTRSGASTRPTRSPSRRSPSGCSANSFRRARGCTG